VYWVNFDETTNELSPLEGSGPYPSIQEGINGAGAPFQFPAETAAEQLASIPMMQLAIVYDNGNPDNLPCQRVNPAVDDFGAELAISETITSSWENNPYKLRDFQQAATGQAMTSAVYYVTTNSAAVAAGLSMYDQGAIGNGGIMISLTSRANLPELRVREE
jgi:hypothetical protein